MDDSVIYQNRKTVEDQNHEDGDEMSGFAHVTLEMPMKYPSGHVE